MKNTVTIAREVVYEVLEALHEAVGLATSLGWVVHQIRFEDAFSALRDAFFSTLPMWTDEE